jgi:S1-C subfamily serine protease
MCRALVVAALCLVAPCGLSAQPLSVLHITVSIVDAERRTTPVPRHALLISANPPTAAPRRILTSASGTVSVSLRPGSYTIESDAPVAFEGKSYEWTQMVEVVAGRDGVLELTAGNAEIGSITAGVAALTDALETDTALLVQPWQSSVVALWTPTTRASGFVMDPTGLVATSRRSIGAATSVEVQITPTVKVTGRVLIADAARDIAVIWIDPARLSSVKAVPLGCARPAPPPLVEGQKIFALGVPRREPAVLTSGEISRVDPHVSLSDFILAEGGVGGPVFRADGTVVGVTSNVDPQTPGRREQVGVVAIGDACNVVASAERKMAGTAPPSGLLLPVEPARPFPADELREAVRRRAGSLNPYLASSAGFDLAFITPVLIAGTQQREDQTTTHDRREIRSLPEVPEASVRAVTDFDNWASYVADVPPVLFIRAMPRLVEGFWTTIARGAAFTQGVSVPSIKHAKSSFSRMRLFCGKEEVMPIHPFMLEHRVSESETMDEGLYVFDPGAIGPQCGGVRLVVYSEKAPEQGESRTIDPKLIQQVWEDFAPYRALP